MAGYTTTVAAVNSVMDTEDLGSDVIQQFINDIDLWIAEEMLNAGLSYARLEVIERYLVCAMIRLRLLGLAQSYLGGRSGFGEKYQVDPTTTDYLLRAAALDASGKIRKVFIEVKKKTSGTLSVAAGFNDQTTNI